MKKIGVYILLSFLMIGFSSLTANALEPNDTVISYFQALKAGDVKSIKNLITGELFDKRKVLLEQNENYPEFLKRHYQGAEFQIKAASIKDNNAQINVEVNFPDGIRPFVLFLIRDDAGNWKIFKEINE